MQNRACRGPSAGLSVSRRGGLAVTRCEEWTSPAALLFMVTVPLSPRPQALLSFRWAPLSPPGPLPRASLSVPPPARAQLFLHPPPGLAAPRTQLSAGAAKLRSRNVWEPGVSAQVLQEAEPGQESTSRRFLRGGTCKGRGVGTGRLGEPPDQGKEGGVGGTDLRGRFGQADGEYASWGGVLQARVSWERAMSGPAAVTSWLGAAGGSAGPRGTARGPQSPPQQET